MAQRYVHSVFLAALVAGVCFAPRERMWAQTPATFSAQSSLVVLRVSVIDGKAGFVSNLTKEAFSVSEAGAPQPIAFFSNEDLPVTLGLVVDSSGSMAPKRDLVRTAGVQFAAASNPRDEMFVVAFNERVWFGLPPRMSFTSDLPTLRQALGATGARGRTGLYQAVAAAMDRAAVGTCDQKALVVLSDGADNASAVTLDALIERIKRSHVVVYTVGLFDRDDPDGNPKVLRELARASGGEVFLIDRATDVVPTLQRIARDIRHSYTMGTCRAAPATPGIGTFAWRSARPTGSG